MAKDPGLQKFADVPDNVGEIILGRIKLYLEAPEQAHFWDAAQIGGPGVVSTLLLTTTGRKTGKPRHAPILYVDNDGSYLVVGSKGGDATHPVWYLNLVDTPECEIRVGALRTRARARTLEGEERERAWTRITTRHDVFLKYQARTERRIPVILLEPIKG